MWRALVLMAVLNNVLPFTLLGWGQVHIASGLAAILNATTPLFAAVVAHFATADEPFTLNRGLGVLLGLVGVAAMFGPSAFEGLGINTAAELACLTAALCYGVSGVYGRRFGRMGISPTTTATGQLICSAAIMIALALVFDRPWTLSVPAWPVIASILALAVLSTVARLRHLLPAAAPGRRDQHAARHDPACRSSPSSSARCSCTSASSRATSWASASSCSACRRSTEDCGQRFTRAVRIAWPTRQA